MPEDEINPPLAEGEIFLKVTKIQEEGKTRRTKAICASVVTGVGLICWAYVQANTPSWETVALAVLALFGGSAGLSRIVLKVSSKRISRSEAKARILEKEIKRLKGGSDDK